MNESEPEATIPPNILSHTRDEVFALLSDWRNSRNGADPSWHNFTKDDVKMTVMFDRSGRAEGVAVVNLQGKPISVSRLQELLLIIGGDDVEIETYNSSSGRFARIDVPRQGQNLTIGDLDGDIVGFSIGNTY